MPAFGRLTAIFAAIPLLALPAAGQAPLPSFQGLGQMPGAVQSGSYVNGISGDGSTVVGYGWVNGASTHAYRWTAVRGYEVIGAGTDSRAYAASFDGSVVVGQ